MQPTGSFIEITHTYVGVRTPASDKVFQINITYALARSMHKMRSIDVEFRAKVAATPIIWGTSASIANGLMDALPGPISRIVVKSSDGSEASARSIFG